MNIYEKNISKPLHYDQYIGISCNLRKYKLRILMHLIKRIRSSLAGGPHIIIYNNGRKNKASAKIKKLLFPLEKGYKKCYNMRCTACTEIY